MSKWLTSIRVFIILAHASMYYLLGSASELTESQRYWIGGIGVVIAALTPIVAASDPAKAAQAELSQIESPTK